MFQQTNPAQFEELAQSFWLALVKLVDRRPQWAPLLLARSHQLLESFVHAYQVLCLLPRPARRRWQRRLGSSLAGAALALTLGNAPAHAAGITVSTNVPDLNPDTQCSLLEAIINANDDAATYADCGGGNGADTITLSGNTYTLTTTHEIGIGLPVISSTITIEGNGAIFERDGNADPFTILVVDSGGDLTLNTTTVTGGAADLAGGIYNDGGAVTLNHSTVSDNFAYLYGGGILNVYGMVTLNDSTVSGNVVLAGDGGGIFNVGTGRVARASQLANPQRKTRQAERQHFARRQARASATDVGAVVLISSTVTGNIASLSGGGMFNLGGSLTLTSSSVTTNTAYCCGGGLYNYDGAVTLADTTVISNTAGHDGGGINSTFGDLTLKSSSSVRENKAGNDGGGIDSFYSTVQLTDSTVSSNQAGGDGGGIDIYGGSVALTNSTLSANQAAEDGGGMDPDQSVVTFMNSTIAGNSAGYAGGALLMYGGAITLTNTTVSGNEATDSGGGLFATGVDASMTVIHSTITGNTANVSGGGLFNTTGATVNLTHTLISGNTATTSGNEIYNKAGEIVNTDNGNLFGDSSESTAQALAGLVAGSGDLTATNDGTQPTALASILNLTLADNGGGTQTHALVSSSPAIDAAGATGPSTDQRGVARPQGVAFDIGAFEVKVVNSSVTQTTVSAGAYNSTPVACGASNLPNQTVTPTIHNNTGTIFSGLFFKVKTLDYKAAQAGGVQPKLCNADTPGAGVGATLTVAGGLAANSNLTPAPVFVIGLPVRAAYRFFVDLYSTSAVATYAGPTPEGEYLGSFAYEFDENGALISNQNTLFLPVIVR